MNSSKIVLPKNVAEAIRHYTDLADTKTEAFTDILSLGYEAERSELILRYFDGNYDELMEALICGYEVEVTPEDKVREFYRNYVAEGLHSEAAAIRVAFIKYGVKIDGVNDNYYGFKERGE
jgi:hypothetical protein